MAVSLTRLAPAPDLVEQAHRALLDAICDGSLPPGARVTQEDLAERLAVSRQPVLQALRLLKAEGFLQDAPGRGLQVAPLDVRWVRQVYQVRGALDALAARLAAQAGCRIDPTLIARGRKAAAGDDIPAMIDADVAFHQAICRASGNPLLERITDQHWQHLRRVMGAVLQTARRASVWDEHEAIAEAIAAGRADAAVALTGHHNQHAADGLARGLSQVLNLSHSGDTP